MIAPFRRDPIIVAVSVCNPPQNAAQCYNGHIWALVACYFGGMLAGTWLGIALMVRR